MESSYAGDALADAMARTRADDDWRPDDIRVRKVYDEIERPEHYTSHPSGIEPIQITRHETFLRGNILKYVFRAPYKGTELKDLKKAKMYLEWEIERVENAT